MSGDHAMPDHNRDEVALMTIRLGDEAPDFTAETTAGTLSFHEWKDNSWAVLFSHPADFTPVCTTELARTATLADEFERRGVKAIALSIDSLDSHRGWVGDIAAFGGSTVEFPIVADPSREIATAYDMIHPGEGETSTVRSVFIVDPANRVRLTLTYPKSVGRNFDEVLRVLDALQLTDRAPVSTPADWQPGQRVIVSPTLSTAEARTRFEEVEEVSSYLRWTPEPSAG